MHIYNICVYIYSEGLILYIYIIYTYFIYIYIKPPLFAWHKTIWCPKALIIQLMKKHINSKKGIVTIV